MCIQKEVLPMDKEHREKRSEWLGKARELEKEGQYEKAIEYYDLVIGANLDHNGRAHHLKGRALARLDRLEEAADCLKESLEIDPINSRCAIELGRVSYELGRWNDARSAFKRILYMGGIVYGDDDKAREWLKRMDREGH
jgi:tetratricopeptide (TPR) repeat protein